MTMTYVTAIALTDIEYNGSAGRAFAKKDSVVSDLTEDECLKLEAMKAVRRMPFTEGPKSASHATSETVPSRFRRKKRGR
jgi:hypothetical protein